MLVIAANPVRGYNDEPERMVFWTNMMPVQLVNGHLKPLLAGRGLLSGKLSEEEERIIPSTVLLSSEMHGKRRAEDEDEEGKL